MKLSIAAADSTICPFVKVAADPHSFTLLVPGDSLFATCFSQRPSVVTSPGRATNFGLTPGGGSIILLSLVSAPGQVASVPGAGPAGCIRVENCVSIDKLQDRLGDLRA